MQEQSYAASLISGGYKLLSDIFRRAVDSKYNSPALIVIFNAASVLLAGASGYEPVPMAFFGAAGGVIGLFSGRLIDGAASWRADRLVRERHLRKSLPDARP